MVTPMDSPRVSSSLDTSAKDLVEDARTKMIIMLKSPERLGSVMSNTFTPLYFRLVHTFAIIATVYFQQTVQITFYIDFTISLYPI